MREITIDFGINNCFMARRWEKPENWVGITKQLGYDYMEFDSDCLDPFFSGDRSYQQKTAALVRQIAKEEGLHITDYYTGAATHRFHGLSHSDKSVQNSMRQWMLDAIDISIALGANKIGGHFDAYSVETMMDKDKYRAQYSSTIDSFKDIAAAGRQKGLKALYLEQMYIPSEVPWTLEQTDKYLCDLYKDNKGCDIYLTVDVGHAACGWYGATGDSLYYEEWLKRFAAACEVIHLQQTRRDASDHWPFTNEYNKKGDIRLEEIIRCIKWSYKNYKEQAWAKYLEPAEKNILIVEVIPGSTVTEEKLIQDLSETARQIREHIPEGGMKIQIS